MQAAAGLPLLSGSYATSCKPIPLRSLCSCAATLLQKSLAAWKMNETIRTKYGFMGLNIVLYV